MQWIHIKVCQLKKFANTSAALVPQFVGFSCFDLHIDQWFAEQEHPKTVGMGETQRAQNVNPADLAAAVV